MPEINRPGITEVYGKLASDFVGGGKHSFQVPEVSVKKSGLHIEKVLKMGLEFNYLLNATCISNQEWTFYGQKNIRRTLDWLVDMKVAAVTVSIPYLLEFIKKNYPGLKVYVSVLSAVNSIERARYWQGLGADKITLFNTDLNRNFALLKLIRKNVNCRLQLIANANCLYQCPFYISHGIMASHASQARHISEGFAIDYCRINCKLRQFSNLSEIIRSPWIRPEDVRCYEDVGIDSLKIIDRGMTVRWISLIANAYADGRYEGNLMDLFPSPSKTVNFSGFNLWHRLKYFFRPAMVNLFRFYGMSKLLFDLQIYIDNRLLDDFLAFFHNNDCGVTDCSECGYCDRVAGLVIKADPALRSKVVSQYRVCLSDMVTGRPFEYR